MPIKEMQRYAILRYQGDETIDKRLKLLLVQENRLKQQREEIDQYIQFLDNKIKTYHHMKAEYQKKSQ